MLGWYVLHSKPLKEAWLYNQLAALKIEAYYPCLHSKNRKPHSNKSKPYFPGYLFVKFDLELTGRSVLQWIPGSLGLVTFGEELASVPDGLIQRISHRVAEINSVEADRLEGLKPGDEVMIHSGLFAGYDAIFCARLHGSERVQVFLRLLKDHPIRVDLPVHQIKSTNHNRTLL